MTMMVRTALPLTLAVLALGTLGPGCDRDPRGRTPVTVPAGVPPESVLQLALEPGIPAPRTVVPNPFEGDTFALEEGRRLYYWMNCFGCHFEGGGGIGPAFIDGDFIYGREPAQIFDSIAAGRANGMPAYGRRLPSEKIWQIAAFVELLARRGEEGDRPRDLREAELR